MTTKTWDEYIAALKRIIGNDGVVGVASKHSQGQWMNYRHYDDWQIKKSFEFFKDSTAFFNSPYKEAKILKEDNEQIDFDGVSFYPKYRIYDKRPTGKFGYDYDGYSHEIMEKLETFILHTYKFTMFEPVKDL